ncbi:HD domain-containing protein [Fuchsiella alkaliacetigena]|uniref:HD domain-containing protein n=1 Tax=Fuchsiella alkaliacetigena TaxID=957042 RepID=UPI00200A3CD4|nr:HD domain-containing protein [Fuchsiella alkaliacetigena]MCK8825741.1 HD domain-containing protein [Fuchsiella alkaliacetigena]
MLSTNLLMIRALELAAKEHEGDKRKGRDIPYIVHPVEVAMILQEDGVDEELIAAALLHDTLEDTELSEEQLRARFNDRIVELVLGASEELEDRDNTSWEKRKEHTVNYLKEAPHEVKLIACADKLSNIRSMIRDYERVEDELWDRFNRGYEKQKWYYQSLVESLEDLQGIKMYEQFKLAVEYLF